MRQEKHKGRSVPCQESSCHKIHFAQRREQYQGQDTLASLKSAFFFTCAVFEIFKEQQKTPSPVGRPELSSYKCHQMAQEFTGRQRAH